MSALVIEVRAADGAWVEVARVRYGDPIGSLSHTDPNGDRHVLMFGCMPDHGVVGRSIGGADTESDDGRKREILSIGTEQARLGPGETYEQDVRIDRMVGGPVRVRWRYEAVPR
jgi:hypothetical protein